MTSYFEFREGRKPVGDVLEFKPVESTVVHADASTIVEKLEMTAEMKAEFEAAGYTFPEEELNEDASANAGA